MSKFPIEHSGVCEPTAQCASCRAMTLLRSRLMPSEMQEFVSLAKEAHANGRIEDLEVSVRTANILKNAELNTIDEIAQKTKEEIGKLPHAGKRTVEEVERLLKRFGREFASPPEKSE